MVTKRVGVGGQSGFWLAAAASWGLAAPGCNLARQVGPEDPSPLSTPRTVSVSIEYRQDATCYNQPVHCDDLVAFFGSWMRPGTEFFLTRDPTGYVWTGTAYGVPVNYPGVEPYRVRVFDPHLHQTLTEGFTAERLSVGGQSVLRIDRPGGRNEAGLIFIDANGQGRNPY
jgi:hypothetical protein